LSRLATRSRTTKETSVELSLELDGSGAAHASTGIPFYDHMLEQVGKHGGFDLTSGHGDLHIDTPHGRRRGHHLGEAFRERR
jgi:imidazoleglycerol-phosphate dehydratase